jgi:2-polyprenyl-3-methyl-5-hydroxy-6-metoxy-1,4-benzoquinol methylase
MRERCEDGLPVYSEYNDVLKNAPYQTVTVFEVMEHLQWTELANILIRCNELLAPGGAVVISVPIEIGPVILFKELNRYRVTKEWQYTVFEFIGAFLLGIAGRRENPDYAVMRHKGFDFRDLIRFIKSKGWKTKVLCYGPLPVKIWYGNSQVFIMAKRMNE